MKQIELADYIKMLKEKGVDTTEVEARLQEIISSTASKPLPKAQ